MEEDLRIGDNVLILPVDKMGTIQSEKTGMSSYWVDYNDEYGGLYWYKDDLKLIEDFDDTEF
jgi:hypothetical protein